MPGRTEAGFNPCMETAPRLANALGKPRMGLAAAGHGQARVPHLGEVLVELRVQHGHLGLHVLVQHQGEHRKHGVDRRVPGAREEAGQPTADTRLQPEAKLPNTKQNMDKLGQVRLPQTQRSPQHSRMACETPMCTGSERGWVLFTDILRSLQTQSRRQTRHRGPVRSLPAMAASCPLQPTPQAAGDTGSAQTHTALSPCPPASTPLPAPSPRTPQTCSPFHTFCHFKVIYVQHMAGGCWGVRTQPGPLGLPGACGASLPPPTDCLQL